MLYLKFLLKMCFFCSCILWEGVFRLVNFKKDFWFYQMHFFIICFLIDCLEKFNSISFRMSSFWFPYIIVLPMSCTCPLIVIIIYHYIPVLTLLLWTIISQCISRNFKFREKGLIYPLTLSFRADIRDSFIPLLLYKWLTYTFFL